MFNIGLIVDGSDINNNEVPNKIWVYWIGDGRISNVIVFHYFFMLLYVQKSYIYRPFVKVNVRKHVQHFFVKISRFIDYLENEKSLKFNK